MLYLVLAVAIFVFAKQVIEKTITAVSKPGKVLSWLSGVAFGVYLMHILVMRHIVSWFSIDVRVLWWRLLSPVLLFVICTVAVKLIQKIPFIGKYIIPS